MDIEGSGSPSAAIIEWHHLCLLEEEKGVKEWVTRCFDSHSECLTVDLGPQTV